MFSHKTQSRQKQKGQANWREQSWNLSPAKLRKNLKNSDFIGILLIVLSVILIGKSSVDFIGESAGELGAVEDVADNPEGLYNFAGSPIFASMAQGTQEILEKMYPNFQIRYARPLDGDLSVDNAIDTLIEGEISFVYSDRPLTDAEHEKAKLRSFSLVSVPFALDAVVVYCNLNTPVAMINREQVAKIFRGEITNWNQINPRIKDLPITPVVVNGNEVSGIEPARGKGQIEYVENHSLAMRRIISTPGAISFASASLIEDQQLIKMLALADGDSQNFIRPWSGGKLNFQAFLDGSYPLTRRIYLVYRRDSSRDQTAAEFYADFLQSARGQETIRQSGLLSIY